MKVARTPRSTTKTGNGVPASRESRQMASPKVLPIHSGCYVRLRSHGNNSEFYPTRDNVRELLTLEEIALDILMPGYLLRTYDQFAHRRWTHPLHSPSEASSLQALWESFLF